jgi:hypothetical protein
MDNEKPIYKLEDDYNNFKKDELNYFRDKVLIFDNHFKKMNGHDLRSSIDDYYLDIRSFRTFKNTYSLNPINLGLFIKNDKPHIFLIPKKIFIKGYLDISKYNIVQSFYI